MQTKTFTLSLLLIAFFFLSLSIGSVNIPFGEVIKVLSGQGASKISWQTIIMEFRLPKAITALLAGAGLSISGLLMQTFFRNPLAGPFVLGVSSGASLGVALLILANVYLDFFLPKSFLGPWLQIASAGIGSAAVMILVFAIATRVKDSMSLLIIGIMLASLTGAIVSILQFFSTPEQIQGYLFWTFGSLGGVSWDQLQAFIPVVVMALVLSFFLIKPLNALLLGERYAVTMGLNIKFVRIHVIFCTCLLAGSITAFCGPIAFIGIAVPHLCRILFNTSNHKILVPASILGGALLLLICDIMAQLPGLQLALPINAITSLLGAPLVIWLILRKKSIGSFAS